MLNKIKILKFLASFFVFIFMALFLTNCSEAMRRKIGYHYLPEKAINTFNKDLKSASPEFRRGWLDGCEVGTHVASVNTFYRMFYTNNRVDGYAKINNADYRNAWDYAVWYCMRYEEIKQTSNMWGSMFGGYR